MDDAPLISVGGVAVQYPKALALLKQWCILAGIDKKVGFHSLRGGSATYMDSISIPLHHIQQSGDWQSLCVLNYLSSDLCQRRDIDSQVSRSLVDLWFLFFYFCIITLSRAWGQETAQVA